MYNIAVSLIIGIIEISCKYSCCLADIAFLSAKSIPFSFDENCHAIKNNKLAVFTKNDDQDNNHIVTLHTLWFLDLHWAVIAKIELACHCRVHVNVDVVVRLVFLLLHTNRIHENMSCRVLGYCFPEIVMLCIKLCYYCGQSVKKHVHQI